MSNLSDGSQKVSLARDYFTSWHIHAEDMSATL